MSAETINIFYCITSFQLFFFGLLVLWLRPHRNYQYFLSAFLLIKSLIILQSILTWHYHLIPHNAINKTITSIFSISVCPLFYLFIFTATRNKFVFKPYQILALVPLIVELNLALSVDRYWQSNFYVMISLSIINYYIQAFVYFYLSLRCFRNYRQNLSEFFTSSTIERIQWFRLIIISFLVIWGLAALNDIVGLVLSKNLQFPGAIIELAFLISVNVLLFLGSKQPSELNSWVEETSKRYSGSKLSEVEKDELLQKLTDYIGINKPQRDPELNMNILASKINLQPRQLSQLINERIQKNFCEYINYLRVQDAIEEFADAANEKVTILEILYKCGFNSKSVFNTVFKQITGTTPSDYRRQYSALKQSA